MLNKEKIGIFISLTVLVFSSTAYAQTLNPTIDDFWNDRASFVEIRQFTPKGSHRIVANGGYWYDFYSNWYGGTLSGCWHPAIRIDVRYSTDKGQSWSSSEIVARPISGNYKMGCVMVDPDAFFDSGTNTWHVLTQCLGTGPGWNMCHYSKTGSSPLGGGFIADPANPVVTPGQLWDQICSGSGKTCSNTNPGLGSMEAGTPEIIYKKNGYYYVTFHGAEGLNSWRGVAKTTDFKNWIAQASDLPSDAMFSQQDCQSWNSGCIGGGHATMLVEGGYHYMLIEAPTDSIGCSPGQKWYFGLMRASGLKPSGQWQSYSDNPMLTHSNGSPCLGLQYARFLKDGGKTYLYYEQREVGKIRLFELVFPGNPTPTPTPTFIGTPLVKTLAPAGVFPDIAWFKSRIYVVFQDGANLFLYSYAPDLTGQKVEKKIDIGPAQLAYPRLYPQGNILWMSWRGINNKFNLWRSDTDFSETFNPTGAAGGIMGNGYVAWANYPNSAIFERSLAGNTINTVTTNTTPTGMSRILADGSIVNIDDDRTLFSWCLNPSFAGSRAVCEGFNGGTMFQFNGDSSAQSVLFGSQEAFTPHAATDGTDNYATVTWGKPGIRIAVFKGPSSNGNTERDGSGSNIPDNGNDGEVNPPPPAPPFGSVTSPNIPTEGLLNFGQLIAMIFTWSLNILGIVVFVQIFYAGFKWFTAAGNTARVNEARAQITNAILGAMILLSAYIILYTINPDLVGGKVTLPGINKTQ